MRTLILGASGFVGWHLWKKFEQRGPTCGTYCHHLQEGLVPLDLRDAAAVRRLISKFRPDFVLQPAAQSNVDWCEDNEAESHQINVQGTKNVLEALSATQTKFVFFSSDYVFDGRDGPYAEDEPPNPLNVYGRHKLEAERLIADGLANHLIIRVTVVYGWENQGKNFVVNLVRKLSSGQTMTVPVDQVGTPTYAPNLVDAVEELTRINATGVYNIVGADLLDRYSFSRLAAEVFGLDVGLLIPRTTAELGQKAKRPLQGGLRIDKARRELRTELVSARKGLELMKADRAAWQAALLAPPTQRHP